MTAAVFAWCIAGILFVVLVATSVDHWRLQDQVKSLKLKNSTELRVERDTHRAIQSGAQRQIGILEDRLDKAQRALSEPIHISMQSMSAQFLIHDFQLAHGTVEGTENYIKVEVERALRHIEEKARRELMVVYTEPVIDAFDEVSGKAYRVTVGCFPKFALAPDGGFEIEGHRVEITMLDDDGHEVVMVHPTKISFDRRRHR